MKKVLPKAVKVQYMMLKISSCLIGTTFGNLFGIDFLPPVEVPALNPRFGEVQQEHRSNNPIMQQTTNSPYGWDNLFSNNWSSKNNQNGNFFYPAPGAFFETFQTNLQQPQKVNKLAQDNSLNSATRIPLKKGHGTHAIEKVGPLNPKPKQGTGVLDLVFGDTDVQEGSEAASDRTTEGSEYETTTDHEGEVGGPPPAIVASLLG